jgi:hypothetical protein
MPVRKWKSGEALSLLPRQDGVDLITDALSTYPKLRNEAIHSIIEHWRLGFRRVFVERKGAAWQAEQMWQFSQSAIATDSVHGIVYESLVPYLLGMKVKVVTDFLDYLGISHNDGNVGNDVPSVSEREALDAAKAVAKIHGSELVAVYLIIAGENAEIWRDAYWSAAEKIASDLVIRTVDTPVDEVSSSNVIEIVVPSLSTPLDNLLTQTLVASAARDYGYPSLIEMEDIVDEFIHLNSSRHQSYFHRGFLHALAHTESNLPAPEMNEARSQWELAGNIFGLARLRDHPEVVSIWDKKRREVNVIISDHPAGPRVVPLLWDALWAVGRHSEAINVLRPATVAGASGSFREDLLQTARVHRLNGFSEEARGILDVLHDCLPTLDSADVIASDYEFTVRRELAVCVRSLGDFDSAAAVLELLLDRSPADRRGEILSILALSRSQFRNLSDVSIGVEPDEASEIAQRIKANGGLFDEASISDNPVGQAIGNYCLGVASIIDGDHTHAMSSFSKSYSATMTASAASGNSRFAENLKMGLAIAILGANNRSRFLQALELLTEIADSADRPPASVVLAAAEGVLLVEDPELRGDLLEPLWRLSPDLLDELIDLTFHDPALIPEGIVRSFEDGYLNESTALETSWSQGTWLYKRAATSAQINKARSVLDHLEHLAISHSDLRGRYVEFLQDENEAVTLAWDEESVRFSRVNISEMGGDLVSAAVELTAQFHEFAARDRAHEAAGILERIRSYGLDETYVTELEPRLLALSATEDDKFSESRDSHLDQVPVSVLFVGGDESESKFDEQITHDVMSKSRNTKVDFVHPGFSSNWGSVANRVIERLHDYDVLVLSPFVRTEFGRTLRRRVDETPGFWFSCTGRGKTTTVRAIVEASRLAAVKKLSKGRVSSVKTDR